MKSAPLVTAGAQIFREIILLSEGANPMAGDLDAAISAYLQVKTHSDAAVDVMESAAERNASRIITLVRMRNLQDAVGRGVPLTLLTRVWRAKVMARPQ